MPNPLIWTASQLWSLASAVARLVVIVGLRKPVRLPVRVISVGNIQVGGSGKTPLVAQIAREAHERGLRVCILSRGYGGSWEKTGGILWPDRAGDANVAECGDECALLRKLAPFAVIGVGANRVAQYEMIAKAGVKIDLVILDDGFQNWRIRKDLEIVAVTSSSAWKVLHRDWPSALTRADLVVWTKGEILPWLGESSAPLVRVRFVTPQSLTQDPVWLACGVADGAEVLSGARAAGYEVSKTFFFADHARYTSDQVERLQREAKQAGASIALTGKDWAKWRELGVREQDVIVLEPEVQFVSGRTSWVKVLWGSE